LDFVPSSRRRTVLLAKVMPPGKKLTIFSISRHNPAGLGATGRFGYNSAPVPL